jgi:hypothetical protein
MKFSESQTLLQIEFQIRLQSLSERLRIKHICGSDHSSVKNDTLL